MGPVIGREWKADGTVRVLPQKIGDSQGFGSGTARRFEFPLPQGRTLVMTFPEPVFYQAQDARLWGSRWSIRFGRDTQSRRKYVAGERLFWSVDVSASDGAELKDIEPVTIKEGPEWVRIDCRREVLPGSALDFSGMHLLDAPAGKNGWLRNVGGNFEFERLPGKPQRFYGVNLSHTANYPDHSEADRLIDRFVRIGYNAIRVHHHDRFWNSNENRERLDYLVARAIEKGLYVTTDLYVSRPVEQRALGIDRDGVIEKNEYKRMVASDDRAFNDWCGFVREFLEHVNPYTGRAYKNEPAMPLISLINEGGESLQAWERCSAFVRSLGANAMLTNDNDGRRHGDGEGIVSHYDYVDTHSYVDHPVFISKKWSLPSRCDNGNPVMSGRPEIFARDWSRHSVKPHVASEWNFSGPGRYRSLAGLVVGFQAAAQEWDGLWRFAYSHSDKDLRDGAPCSPDYFNIANDPVMQAADRAGICLYLRGDARTDACEYHANPKTGELAVATPFTCGGFKESGCLEAGPLKAELSKAPAAVWISSLDGKAISNSDRMLLVHLTDVQAEGRVFADSSREIMLSYGSGHLLQVGEAAISIKMDGHAKYMVYGLDMVGHRVASVPATMQDGRLCFIAATASDTGGRIYYEIASEKKSSDATYRVDVDNESGIYRCGELATFSVRLISTNGLSVVQTPWATLDDFGASVLTNMIFDIADTCTVFTISGTLREPGFLRLSLPPTKNGRKDPFVFCVGFEPEKIRKGSPSPDDFDDFWAKARARLAREVPLDPQIVRIPERSTADFDFYRVSFATFGRRVHGYMSVPTDKSKMPFPVDSGVNAAGFGDWTNDMHGEKDSIRVQFSVYPFPPDWKWRENGLNEAYNALDKEARSRYGASGYCTAGITESREAYFFYPVILGIDRAVNWVAARPDVDLSRFRYQGTSQGGGFGFYLCGLNHAFTRAVFYVPAMTDTMGYLKGRASGWPKIVESNSATPELRAAAEKWAPYFDGANFASRIICPVRVVVGFSDTTCPPCAVYAAYNEIRTPDKAIANGIGMTHSCFRRFYAEFGQWVKVSGSPSVPKCQKMTK